MLLAAVAHQLGGAGYSVLLAAALQRSRERLVQAREEERRRLRRDLHDGLGPRLATVAMQLEVARALVFSEPEKADHALERIHHQSISSITEIRRLVDDLRPPSLDELGLMSALQEQTQGATTATADGTRRSLPVLFYCPDVLPALPAAVEVAAYRIVLEAVNNVSKHARASCCTVRVEVAEDLILTVRDDGIGIGDRSRTGVGLVSMSDRAAELGGSCTITDAAPGTTITARLPLTRLELTCPRPTP
jgi:two-component system, NarL family, sensor kinase